MIKLPDGQILVKSQFEVDEKKRKIKAAVDHSLYQDEDWYLVPRDYFLWYIGAPHQSILFHVCSKVLTYKVYFSNQTQEKYATIPYEVYRRYNDSMEVPCSYCDVAAPQSLIALWRLHNWDTL